MNRKFGAVLGAISAVVIITVAILYQFLPTEEEPTVLDELLQAAESDMIRLTNDESVHMYPPEQSSLFYVYAYKHQFRTNPDGSVVPNIMNFLPKKELKKTYEEIGLFKESEKTVAIIPVFTASAYKVPGFYNYYDGTCGEECLTVPIQETTSGFTSSDNAVKILRFLQYSMITDVDVDKNPDIIKNYDTVIVLHSEYVTRNEFDAIISHPKVIYLYPNALYAEVESNYDKNTITLKKGHNYPSKEIKNGFDWEFDNSQFEYDQLCNDWNFYKVSNGWMLNCYPEDILIIDNEDFLRQLKEFLDLL